MFASRKENLVKNVKKKHYCTLHSEWYAMTQNNWNKYVLQSNMVVKFW